MFALVKANYLLGRNMKKIYSTLQLKRTTAGLTAADLARLADTAEMRVYQFERGRFRPRPDEAARIAKVLGADVDDLFPAGVQQLKGGAK